MTMVDAKDRAALESALLIEVDQLDGDGDANARVDSRAFASTCVSGGLESHEAVQSAARSLAAAAMMTIEEVEDTYYVLTDEGGLYAREGSPEYLLVNHLASLESSSSSRSDTCPDEANAFFTSLSSVKEAIGNEAADIGIKQAMQRKWILMKKIEGVPMIAQKKSDGVTAGVKDVVREQLMQIEQMRNGGSNDGSKSGSGAVSASDLDKLKKRKLIKLEKARHFMLGKGPKFALRRSQQITDLTQEMLLSGAWRDADCEVKPYNFDSLGVLPQGGHLHPLLKVRTQFREIFLQMGFEEMPTNNFVESSFWNFDALFQPQMHPARDAHDTFFIKDPALSNKFPDDYLESVKKMHESGGFGSFGYGYDWKRSEAQKNLLRTHTTAVSSRMLYRLARGYCDEVASSNGSPVSFTAKKMFSIDRVFRNEAIDKTHLAEFHQIEGVCVDTGLCLADLIGLFKEFFKRLGMTNLKFKPAFNPYTEPSMEIFAFHKGLDEWIEVGNSGMFRPEMVRPMGLPAGVNAIAWGLSLERPTMVLYGIDNIRELFGVKVDLNMIQKNPLCRMGM